MLINTQFILASSSKSRYKILKKLNLNFSTKRPACDEEKIKKNLKKTKSFQIAKHLAKAKAQSISQKHPKEIVVGCDTVLVFQNKIINKAKNLNEAFMKIKKLSGKKHKIISAVSVCKNNKQIWSYHQTSIVSLRQLNKNNIEDYLKKTGKQILNSVGCYQVELLGPAIIENIKGDFFNVMGFPLFPFLKFIKSQRA